MRKSFAMLSLVLGTWSFHAHAGDHVRWTEEVKLSNGDVIQIQRHSELTDSGFPLQKRGFTKYYEICYPPLKIHWKSKGGYQPDIFDIVDGKAYVHVPVSSFGECDEQGYPAPNALYFAWESGRWKRITHEEFPAASEWNLLMQMKGGSPKTDPQGLITLQDKIDSPYADSSLLFEQKRLGWRRINESYYKRTGCDSYRPKAFDQSGNSPKDIFINDGKAACQFE